jgi:CheY-like chemotaxis protein
MGPGSPGAQARPLAVLVVEDEMLVGMLVEDMLSEIGCTVAGVATGLDDALRLAREAEIDFAILDVNLDGRESYPVAEALRARGLPFAFATGYGRGGLDEAYADVPTLPKPFRLADLEALLLPMVPGRASEGRASEGGA